MVKSTNAEWLVAVAGAICLIWVSLQPSVNHRKVGQPLPDQGQQPRQQQQRPGTTGQKGKRKSSVPNTVQQAHWAAAGSCKKCHIRIAAQFAQSSKTKSVLPVTPASPVWNGATLDPGGRTGYSLASDSQRVLMRERLQGTKGRTIMEHVAKIGRQIGSGRTGVVFLSRGKTAPVWWHVGSSSLRLLPHYEVDDVRQFEAPFRKDCRSCHVGQVGDAAGKPTKELQPLNCQSCHGPSARHVAHNREKSAVSNPHAHTVRASKSLCFGCHVTPASRFLQRHQTLADFSGDRSLQDVFVILTNGSIAPDPVSEMFASACFLQGGQLTCLSCHDAHTSHTNQPQHYRQRCVQCHDGQGPKKNCKLPEAVRRKRQPDDSCIACHMPRRKLAGKLAAGLHGHGHDHRILRHANRPPPAKGNAWQIPTWFERPANFAASDVARVRALARWRDLRPTNWLEHAIDGMAPPVPAKRLAAIQSLLQAASVTANDERAAIAQAELALCAGRYPQAIKLLQARLEFDSSDPWVWTRLALAQLHAQQLSQAKQSIARATKGLPERSGPALLQAKILWALESHAEAVKAAEHALRINPRRWETRRFLLQAYSKTGNERGRRRQRALLKRVGQLRE